MLHTARTAIAGGGLSAGLTRIILGAVLGEAFAVAWMTWLVLTVGGLGQALLTSAVVPDVDLLLRMLLGASGVAGALALPLGTLAGVASGARRLSEDRAWLGLRSMGFGGRAIALPVMGVLVVVGVIWLGLAHGAEPASRALLREARVAAAVRVAPIEGRTVRIGGWSAALDGGSLHFAGEEWLGEARGWRIEPAIAGVIVALEDGELRSTDGRTHARFDTLRMPVPLVGTSGRVHASERATPDLMRQLAVSAALGRDGYERWILWKRTLLPLCLLPLGLAAIPLGLRRRWPVLGIVGAMVVSVWGVVRIADQWVGQGALPVAAALTFGTALAWMVGAWWRWSDA